MRSLMLSPVLLCVAVAAAAAQDAEAEKTKRRGFARNQKDINRVKDAAINMDGGATPVV